MFYFTFIIGMTFFLLTYSTTYGASKLEVSAFYRSELPQLEINHITRHYESNYEVFRM